MAQQTIDFEGAFIKSIKDSINDNFTELYEYASSSLSNLIHTFDIVQDADNSSELNTLISTVSSLGGGVILLSEGNMNNGRIVPKSGVFLIGSGWKTTFKTDINRVGVYQNVSTEDLKNFGIFNCRFVGGVTEYPTQPQHLRSGTGTGMTTAFEIHGDLEPTSAFAGAGGTKENIYFCNNWVERCSSLPILIGGATNVYINNNTFDNNKDVGVRFCKNVQCNNNRVLRSQDNGISLSRGNENVVATGNIISLCAYDGIWLGGVGTDEGCKNASITGNTITDCGFNGVNGKLGAKNIVVSGNFIKQGYWRGPIDELSNINSGCGVMFGGIPDDSASPTDFADNILVTNNILMNCARAGVYSRGGTKNSTVSDNKIFNVGNQYAADGVTAISTSDTTTNCGIIFANTGANFNNRVFNNTIDDTRGTSYMNYPLVPTTANTTFNHVKDNSGNGSWRNPSTYPWSTGNKQGFSAGTAYALTATSSAVAFGTTQPTVTITEGGVYNINCDIIVKYNAATFAASRTVTFIVKKYNGSTYTTLSNGTFTFETDVTTTKTANFIATTLRPFATTLLPNEQIVLFADVSVVPSAGSLDLSSAIITAIKQ